MKAIQIHSHGGVDKLCFEETGDPALESPGDVIVKLRAAAINRVDIAIRSGQRRLKIISTHLGSDGAGTIVAVGAHSHPRRLATTFVFTLSRGADSAISVQANKSTCAQPDPFSASAEHGTYAEYMSVPGKNCFAIPAGLSFEEAAAFPLV